MTKKRWDWQCKCYAHAVALDDINGGSRLAKGVTPEGTKERTKCPGCGRLTQDGTLVDMRNFPAHFIAQLPPGVQWFGFACSGCTSAWERLGLDCGDGRLFDYAMLLEFAGAPSECLREERKKIDDREKRFARSKGAELDNMANHGMAPERLGTRNLGGERVARKVFK